VRKNPIHTKKPLSPSPIIFACRSILDCLSLAMANGASKSEVLAEAIPEALKNMLLSLQSKGILKEGWRDSDGTDLSDLTWKVCKRISPNLTPTSLMQ
jgi:brefeldin A-resistance guanine nucleotide exchange factor 1